MRLSTSFTLAVLLGLCLSATAQAQGTGRSLDIQPGARQNGLRLYSMSEYTDLAKRDAELVAHAEFRKQLYAFDVVTEAEKVAVGVGVG